MAPYSGNTRSSAPRPAALSTQRGDLGFVVGKPRELGQRILRGGDMEGAAHNCLIQNCRGFSVSPGWSMSFQAKRATAPSTGA